MSSAGLIVFLCVLIQVSDIEGALKEGDCEVCIKFVTRLENDLKEEKISGEAAINEFIRKKCAEVKESKENRFCYYIGGSKDSATGMLKQLSGPLENFFPPEKICEKLKKADPQTCDLKYDKPLDWKNINLKKMRVKELKKILSGWDDSCYGCVEKQDFIDRIEELKPHFVREEL